MSDSRTVSAADFTPLLGTGAVLSSEEGVDIPVTLALCRESPRGTMPGSPRTAFSLFLQCPENGLPHFNGAPFTLRYGDGLSLGPVYVERIMPVGVPAGHAQFQIIFN
jgi:hypothetical protein